ncbi:tetratricopeptide repeat protein [Aliarcobacter butzleri]|uniref:tetratricopeptide repeat protein n=1 Tax=Aliarcobacter butzleri TaxID=28197 RepID=UPI00125ED489|nr:tetratricopeptide repeat protein [Aliarcobacter butzleri]MCG3686112.1 sel1 repeat family protein [Aliarcobacter butzleri]MDN5089478.1 tetratricopeptide repeat protein [Aliarcobacter butzleri]
MYSEGKFVKQDYRKAIEWFSKSVSQNNPLAQFNLAYIYITGEGVKQDVNEAVKLYEKSAQQGFLSSQLALANLYLNGYKDLKQDRVKAREWYEKACEENSREACEFLQKN